MLLKKLKVLFCKRMCIISLVLCGYEVQMNMYVLMFFRESSPLSSHKYLKD